MGDMLSQAEIDALLSGALSAEDEQQLPNLLIIRFDTARN